MTIASPASGLELTWHDDIASLQPLADDWLRLGQAVKAEIFMLPDWQTVWWRHFNKRRKLACLVARHQGALVGVLPFAVETNWIGPLPTKIARLAGTDPNCIVFQLALDPAWADAILTAALTHLTGPAGCLAVSFTPVSERAVHAPYLRNLPAAGAGLALVDGSAGSHIIFEMPPTFDEYLANLSKGRRDQYRRNVRALTKTFEMTKDQIVPDAAQFDDFVDMHNSQWQAAGRGGHFVDWPGSAGFYRDLAVTTADRARLQLDRLMGNIGVLAQEMSLIASGRAHWRLPARNFDPEVHRQSAGTVVFVSMFQRMLEHGITQIEAGRGEYGYKVEFGGVPVPVHRMIVLRASALSQLRLKMLLGWADLLHFVYYRVWFLKLVPRVQKQTGRKPRPLWRSWIRTRL